MSREIESLVQGYQEFHQKYFEQDVSLFKQLVEQGQSPKFLVISCSDSRVDPSILFNCQPGDLFVVRNVANLVPPYEADQGYHGTSAAIEFAVRGLNIKDILILGHSQCGGIQSLMENAAQPDSFLGKWTELARPARQRVLHDHPHAPDDKQKALCGQYALEDSLKNLESFPWIAEKVKSKEIEFHGWYFELSSGTLYALNSATGRFEALRG